MEGFGLVFLEAQASGLPVIAPASGGIPDAVNPATGCVLLRGEPTLDEVVAALADARAADPKMEMQRRSVLRTHVENCATWRKYLERFGGALGDLLR